MLRLGNNEVLKTLTKTSTFVDTDTNANAEGSTVVLLEHCSSELIKMFAAVISTKVFA